MGGRNPFCSSVEKSYYQKIDQVALSAVREKSRFRCLNTESIQLKNSENLLEPTSKEMFRRLTLLDTKLNQINAKRVAQILQLDPSFIKLKNSFLGLHICGGFLEEWLPSEVIQKIRSEKFLSKSFREAKTDREWQIALNARVQKEVDLQKKLLKSLELQMTSNKVAIDSPIETAPLNELRCESNLKDVQSRLFKGSYSLSQSDLKVSWSPELQQVFRKFQASASLQGLRVIFH